MYANLESFFAVVAAAVMLGERVEWTALAGGAAVVAGVVLTRRPAAGRAPPHDPGRHRCFPTCRNARRIAARHRAPLASEARAAVAGYRPCKVCRPLTARSA